MPHPSFERVDHRPWPLPRAPWILTQTWSELLFAHWPVRPEDLADWIPPGLDIDLFEGEAWLGIVPFRMSGVRLRCAPPIPGASSFAEINVRTYVRVGDRAGVFFLSLDAASPLAVWTARRWFHLPYFRAAASIEEGEGGVRFRSERREPEAPPAVFDGAYRATGPPREAAPGSLEQFLTERYALFAVDGRDRILTADVHHLPWPLQPAEAALDRNTLATSHAMTLPAVDPLLHYARRVVVATWGPRRLRPGEIPPAEE